ncbi:hypothetical protein OH805_35195 [Streptomyces sp. NBC_00879]|uniref:wax ester/triacylglycerol synthase domain-containing protein n=1 Tax=Streptomyces sp. NBC_00879 TaxID=2975855 RepID=UPI0038699931|nr:hypothetical protein OH805_35195 [Streptomyces sp. NBC_00879]
MERLGPQDLMLLWPDDLGWPETIGALAIVDGTRLLDPDGRFRVEAVREVIESRLPLVPRFRQLLYTPRRGLGWPLWEMWFLPGLADDRVAMFMKVHHTIADGAAGVALLGTFLDPSADAPTMPARPWTPAPEPSSRDLFEDNLRRRVQAAEHTLSKLRRPATTLHQAQERWPEVREGFIKERAPRTSFNTPIGRHRRMAVIHGSLDVTKQIAHNPNAQTERRPDVGRRRRPARTAARP